MCAVTAVVNADYIADCVFLERNFDQQVIAKRQNVFKKDLAVFVFAPNKIPDAQKTQENENH
jgi:hypothetical protein